MTRSFELPRRSRGNALMGPVFFLGVFAGIAVPAYQDYTLRAQVTQGLHFGSELKIAVAEAFAATGKWPRDLRELKYEKVPRGKYVMFAAINHGTVVIRYSATAGAPVARHQLTLRPTVNSSGDVVWSCGLSQDQGVDPDTGAASPHATTIEPKYLPKACRG